MSVVLKANLEIVPGYHLVRPLGQGAAGSVWVARASGGVSVAIKVVSDLESVLSERELRAIRIVHQVKHPHLCPIFGVWFLNQQGALLSPAETDAILEGQVDRLTGTVRVGDFQADWQPESQASHMVIAMGLGDGTLLDRLHQVNGVNQAAGSSPDQLSDTAPQILRGIDRDELIGYFSAAASAIDELNLKHNIYHCDLKPQNILLVGGHAQVCDFGLARQVDDIRKTSIAMGTPAYGAPEMLFERTYSKTLDQYSLAITYYHLRTGKFPFDSLSQSAIFQAKLTGELDLSALSGDERKVVSKASQLNPDDRFENCQAFVRSLQNAANPNISFGDEVARNSNRFSRRSILTLVAGMGLACLILFAAMSQMGRDNDGSREQTSSIQATPDKTHSDPVEPDPAMHRIAEISPDFQEKPSDKDNPQTLATSGTELPPPMPPPTREEPKRPLTLQQQVQQEESLEDQLELLIAASTKENFCSNLINNSFVDSILSRIENRLFKADDPLLEKLSGDEIRFAERVREFERVLGGCEKELASNSEIRLAVLKFATDLALADRTSESRDQVDPGPVRLLLETGQLHEPHPTSIAALLVASTWTPKFSQSDWDIDLAEQDISRVEQLSEIEEVGKVAVNRISRDYLAALLIRRNDAQADEVTNQIITRVAGRLRDKPEFTKMATASLWLVSPDDNLKPVTWKATDFKATTPNQLKATLLVGAAFSQFDRGSKSKAFETWKELLANDPPNDPIAKFDQRRAAKQWLDWTIQQSGVTDQETKELRYADKPEMYQTRMRLIEQLAHDDVAIRNEVVSQTLIGLVAAKDWAKAAAELERLEDYGFKIREAVPQFARALFDLSLSTVSTKAKEDLEKWNSRLIAATLAQPVSDRQDLFVRCYKPVVEQCKPVNWAGPSRSQLPMKGVSDAAVIQFCHRFLTLAQETENLQKYPTIESCQSDIEFVAQLGGFRSAERDERANFYCQAIAAFQRQRYERQSDVSPAVVISRHQTYSSEARQRGRSVYQNFMDAMLANERASVATDEKSATEARQRVIDRTTIFLDKMELPVSNDLRSMATNYFAAALMEQAFFDPSFNGAASNRSSLNDPSPRKSLLASALWEARSVAEQKEPGFAKEEGLATLSKIACRIAINNRDGKASERYQLVDEAIRSIDAAIESRKANSMEYTNLAIEKIYVHWIDTLISAGNPRFDQAKRTALNWISQISTDSKKQPLELSLRADSFPLQCDWHFKAGVTLHQCGEGSAAKRHLAKGFTIATSKLDPTDQIRHLVTLAYVSLASEELARNKDRQLYQNLKQALDSINAASPPIAKKRDNALKLLGRIMSSKR